MCHSVTLSAFSHPWNILIFEIVPPLIYIIYIYNIIINTCVIIIDIFE